MDNVGSGLLVLGVKEGIAKIEVIGLEVFRRNLLVDQLFNGFSKVIVLDVMDFVNNVMSGSGGVVFMVDVVLLQMGRSLTLKLFVAIIINVVRLLT